MRKFSRKKICFISSTRADFGIMSKFIETLQKDKSLDFKLIVTGSHLKKKYGSTFKEIKNEKIKIYKKIKILNGKNDKISLLKNSSKILLKFSKELKKLSPNLIILLGDRYEIFCVAYCAFILGIPIGHFYGGEVTENSLDDSLRHSITKLSNFHFVSTRKYKQRIIQLGEEKRNVFHIGSLSLDNFRKFNFIKKTELEKKLNINIKKKLILCTLHPETNNLIQFDKKVSECFKSLKKIKGTTIIFTNPNDDLGTDTIIKQIKEFCKTKKDCYFFKSLGRKMYLSFLKEANIVIGNSSSGIIETPSTGTFTINLGKRQTGRVRAKNVFDVKFKTKDINKKINHILNMKKQNFHNPYYKLNSMKHTISIIKKLNLSFSKQKKFFDIKYD